MNARWSLSPAGPRRVLMTVDAVGGVWRYGIDLCRALSLGGVDVLLVGFGPTPSSSQNAEALAIPGLELCWTEHPLDWMADKRSPLAPISDTLNRLADKGDVDVFHLNLPSQAVGIEAGRPVVAASHSCFETWWRAVRPKYAFPEYWMWHREVTAEGFQRADTVLSPSRSHARALEQCYGNIERLKVIHNGSAAWFPGEMTKEEFVFSAARWWDPAKNISTLDTAASQCRWPILAAGDLQGPGGETAGTVRNMRTLGTLGRSGMHDMMSKTPVFVSTTLYEPFGLAVLEAARAGAALVLSDIPTYRELWSDAALFVPPLDSGGFAHELNRLAADPGERLRLGREARLRSSRYHLHAQTEAMLKTYAEVCERVGGSPIPAE
ncbi:glycosyltransferase family 4 protein [Flaviflagellibacter deserti]|uniref:Glycosyltransferase family 4 protein n=1 Tax=Flaviflagellibacter deserti TaxID=2267266 RepID=A0ABV9Z0Q3_9HYPH